MKTTIAKGLVIGVDCDQADEGDYKMENGETREFHVDFYKEKCRCRSQRGFSRKFLDNDKFPGGKHLTFGLKEERVDLTKGQLRKPIGQFQAQKRKSSVVISDCVRQSPFYG